MTVRIYNKETYESDYFYDVKEVYEGLIDFVLKFEDEKTILFDFDLYSYAIIER